MSRMRPRRDDIQLHWEDRRYIVSERTRQAYFALVSRIRRSYGMPMFWISVWARRNIEKGFHSQE